MLRARDHHQTEEELNIGRVGTGIVGNNPQTGALGAGILKPHQLC